jgi:hypothetical protein
LPKGTEIIDGRDFINPFPGLFTIGIGKSKKGHWITGAVNDGKFYNYFERNSSADKKVLEYS